MRNKLATICYFGNCDMSFSRNKLYSDILQAEGVTVIECTTKKVGIAKFFDLFLKHWKIRNEYDVLIVGFPGYVTTLLAKIISKKLVVFDALCSRYDSDIISRNAYQGNFLRRGFISLVDWSAFVSADLVLVETQLQKQFIAKRFGIALERIAVAYTGVDELMFESEVNGKKKRQFTVLFRGRIMSEAGVPTIMKAAQLLRDEDIYFDIIGFGWGSSVEEARKAYENVPKEKIAWTESQLPFPELLARMKRADVSLGQFGDSERLDRTVPHKAYESMLLRIPYITAQARGIEEIMENGKHCLMIPPNDPQALADAILLLKNNSEMQVRLARNAFEHYQNSYNNKIIGATLLHDIGYFPKKPFGTLGLIRSMFGSLYSILKG